MKKLILNEEEIAVLLLRDPKTFEELLKENGFSYNELREGVKGLLKKGIIEKRNGFPTKYYLKKEFWTEAIELEKKLDMGSLKTDPCKISKP